MKYTSVTYRSNDVFLVSLFCTHKQFQVRLTFSLPWSFGIHWYNLRRKKVSHLSYGLQTLMMMIMIMMMMVMMMMMMMMMMKIMMMMMMMMMMMIIKKDRKTQRVTQNLKARSHDKTPVGVCKDAALVD